jgi:hypothetical protein
LAKLLIQLRCQPLDGTGKVLFGDPAVAAAVEFGGNLINTVDGMGRARSARRDG